MDQRTIRQDHDKPMIRAYLVWCALPLLFLCVSHPSRFWDETLNTSIVFHRWTNVSSVETMISPWLTLICFDVYHHFCSWWCKWCSVGFRREFRNKLIVSSVWGSNLSHSWIGNFGSVKAIPASRWFLNVLIARSAAFRLCTLVGATWKLTCYAT